MIERAMKMGSTLLEAGKRFASLRMPQCTTPLFGPCLLISLPEYVWIDYFLGGFGFRLFVRLEYTKLFDGLLGTMDMESTIVIKVARILLFIFFFYHMFTHFYQLTVSRYDKGGTQEKLREALGAIKDSTIVNLAKVNSEVQGGGYCNC